MKVFITGGTGCIGQYVTYSVAKSGHTAVVLSREPENYKPLTQMGDITLVKGLITDYPLMREYIKGCDAVIHIALGWGNTPVQMLTNDTAATVNLLEISEEAGVKKFIYTSSTAAMGHNRLDMDETFSNLPLDLYGSTKSASESYILGFKKYYGERAGGNGVNMERNIIRPGYTFANPLYPGATTQKDTRFRDITDAVVNDRPVNLILHDGTQFISSAQISNVYVKLLESDLNEEVLLALGHNFTTWEEIARMALEEYPASKSEIILQNKGWSSVPMMYNVGKIKSVFGLEFDSSDEIRKHVKWNLEQSVKAADGGS